jgi:hypothetical protein
MPLSQIEENMDRAHERDGLLNKKFWFRVKNLKKGSKPKRTASSAGGFCKQLILEQKNKDSPFSSPSPKKVMEEEKNGFHDEDWNETFKEMFIHEILGGKPEIDFKGVYPMIEDYLTDTKCPEE